MRRAPLLAPLLLIMAACSSAEPPRPDRAGGVVRTVSAVFRSFDPARGTIRVLVPGGASAEFSTDPRDTLVFSGIRALSPAELSEGMQLEIDYRGDGPAPRATWIEVTQKTAE